MKNNLLLITICCLSILVKAQNFLISGGNDYSAMVANDQKVYVWGSNSSGQLSADTLIGDSLATKFVNIPQKLKFADISLAVNTVQKGVMPAISKIDAGIGSHMLALSCDKQVWAWGKGTSGQLGRNNLRNSYLPKRVLRGEQVAKVDGINDPSGVFLHDIVAISGGLTTSFAIEANTGKVLAWGKNDYGQLGTGTNITTSTPKYVLKSDMSPLTGIVQVEAGEMFTYALDAKGNVWSWGRSNNSGELGRPSTAATPDYDAFAGLVLANPNHLDNSVNYTGSNPLSNIVEISAGGYHCLALADDGTVWSFGGDWGPGQLGQGAGYQSSKAAGKVVDAGVTATTGPWLGKGVDGKAVSIAASYSSSAIVMANGKVVTFGANGKYIGGTITVPTGSYTCTDIALSSSLGTGQCGNTCTPSNTASSGSEFPKYVYYNTTQLLGIKHVSNGDGWFFATGFSTGGVYDLYTWGWNRRGELGIGSYTDACYATKLVLPANVSITAHCPKKPILPADFSTCPVFKTRLDPQVLWMSSSLKLNWYYRAIPGSGSWTALPNTLDSMLLTVDRLGEYKVSTYDTRAFVPYMCGTCMVLSDSITISEVASPYTASGCWDDNSNIGRFSLSLPANSRVKWFASIDAANSLNPNDELPNIVVSSAQANLNSICGANNHALFAEDLSTTIGTLRATAPASVSNDNLGDSYLLIEATNTLKLTQVSVLLQAQSFTTAHNLTIELYSTNGTGFFCPNCVPSGSFGPSSTAIYTSPIFTYNHLGNMTNATVNIPVNYTLMPGTYYIRARTNNPGLAYFTANPTYNTAMPPRWNTPEVSSPDGLKAILGLRTGSIGGSGNVFNIKFETGTGYTCKRILVCEAAKCVITETDQGQTLADGDFAIVPNPNHGRFTLQGGKDLENGTVVLYNALGIRIMEYRGVAAGKEFDLSHMPAGVYVVAIQNKDLYKTKRVVVE